jgi:putative nucleotidyltransferase with HDIG domain
MSSYQTLIDRLTDLPSPPTIVQKLQTLLEQEDVSSRDIAHVIETDQSFTARTLRVVNSPFYGFARKISSVEEAITVLGLNSVRQLLLTTCLIRALKDDNRALDLQKFWLHSFGVGIIARHLLPRQSREMQNEAFICGVLHDIGRMVFARVEPEKFAEFYIRGISVASIENESAFFGVDHQRLGEMLARKWNFPENVRLAIAYHHTPLNTDKQKMLLAAINNADIICHALDIGSSGNFYVTDFFPETWKLLNINISDVEPVIVEALADISAFRSSMSEIA